MPLDRMPYKLRKAPNRDLYWVVNKETGKKHSNEPLPLERAKAQMKALYASEATGGVKQYLPEPTGSKRISKETFASINKNMADFFDPIEKLKYAKEHPESIVLPTDAKERKRKLKELRMAGIQHPDDIPMTGGRKGEHPVAFADRILSEPRLFSKKQLREARRIKKLEGAGFFGDLWNAAKSIGSKVATTVRSVANVVSGRAPREDYPPYVRGLLNEVGNRPIVSMFVRRDPIQSLLNTALNFISRGKWNEAKAKYAYDKLFHLGLEVIVKVSDQDEIYKRFVIEKNEVINIQTAKAVEKDTETMPVQMGGVGHTINSLLNGAKQVMGAKFFPYDPFHNNCQDFIMSILTGSGIGNDAVRAFVKQPIEEVVKQLPSYTGKIARAITDLGGVVNTAIYGQGGLNPSRELEKQFKKWGVNPTDYLAEAKKKAKAEGLVDNLLGFSDDAKHKLQIPNPDGRMIRFGATGLGDYILYKLSNNPKAEEHRKHYLQRATKIKGDWAKDPYSPNSLAINVLW